MRKNVKEFFSAFSKTTSSKNMLRIFQSLMVLQVFFAEHSLFRLVSSLTRQELTKKEQCLLFVCSKAVDSRLAKLETSHTAILPPMASVL